MLVIKRITVTYRMALDEEYRETAERVLGVHARACPVARSLEGAIEVKTKLVLI